MSVADIAQNGPFSKFPRMDRQLTLIEGRGVVLHGVSGSMRLTGVGDSVVFPGEETLRVELIDGPVRACNVIARRGVSRGGAHLHRGSAEVAGGYHVALILAGEFALRVPSQPDEMLCTGDGIHVENIVDAPVLRPLSKDGAVLCTVIHSPVTQL